MHTVEVSYTVEPSAETLLARLSPTAIVDYAEIYTLESHDPGGESDTVTVSFDDNRTTLEFTETADGYEYAMVESAGIFAERQTAILVEDGPEAETEVSAATQYTLDSRLSVILDRLAASTVRQELELVVENLVADAMDDDS